LPISGLLITLAGDPRASEGAVSALRADHRIVLGERSGPRLPVVVDTPDRETDRRLWRDLNEHPGILKVDLVCAYFDDEALAGGHDGKEMNRHVDE
jgi:hypothetical protein